MHALGIEAGPATDRESALERVLTGLEAVGRVGVVKRGGAGAERTVYEVGADGYAKRGPDLDPEGALKELAVDHDYGVLVGFPEAAVPQVAVGDVDLESPALAVDSVEGLESETVREVAESAAPIETLDSLLARVKRSPDSPLSGAIATFTGRVRAKDHPEDEPTEHLTFEKYEEVAEQRMAEIEADIEDREGVYDVRLHHRVGRIERGEDIVFVVVLAGHRNQAFEAVKDGIDWLKADVPIFKKERTVEESFWVHERDERE